MLNIKSNISNSKSMFKLSKIFQINKLNTQFNNSLLSKFFSSTLSTNKSLSSINNRNDKVYSLLNNNKKLFSSNDTTNNDNEENIKKNDIENENIVREEDSILNYLFEYNIKNNKTPAFKFYPSQIEILNQPSDFYLAIIVRFNYY